MDRHFVYLLQTGSSVKYNEGTYKIGRTTRKFGIRASEYEKGTEVILSVMVDDGVIVEKKIIKLFDKIFVKRLDLGVEYYSGDVNKMLGHIMLIIQKRMNIEAALQQKPLIENNLKILQNKQLASIANRDIPILLKEAEISDMISLTDDLPDIDNDNELNNIDQFCEFINRSRPTWYVPQEWVEKNILLTEYQEKFGKAPQNFYKMLKYRIYSDDKRGVVNGVRVYMIKLFKYQDIILNNDSISIASDIDDNIVDTILNTDQLTDVTELGKSVSDIDVFVDHIKSSKPKWYVGGSWILSRDLYDNFVQATNSQMPITVFARSVNDILASEYKVKKVKDKTKRYVLLKHLYK